jgi:hypothetical protein
MELDDKYKRYVKSIMKEIPVSGRRKLEIEADLINNLIDKEEQNPRMDPIELMGTPSSVASEFRENLSLNEIKGFEYRSGKKVLGIPLIHINLKPNSVAKGIISIGPVAVGVISIGAVAVGLLSFGAFGFGILAAIGAVAFSGIISAGAAAFSIGMSAGAVAMSHYYAIGVFAQANIAIGNVAHGIVAVFQESGKGEFLVQLPAAREEILLAIKTAFPSLSNFWINFAMFPF